jgi:hypothetical protein
MADDADSILKDYSYLWGQQANFRMLWESIAQYVMPAWDNFIGVFSEGVIRTTRLFDATAVSANERFAAAMEQMLTPRTQMWHDIVPAEEELRDDEEVQAYCSAVRKILFAARYRPKANYASQVDECYMSLGAFGNNALLIDEVMGRHLSYRSIPLNELVWALDASGMVDSVYRKFDFSAKQCFQMWGDKCSPQMKEALDQTPYKEFQILHCVRPNRERTKGAIGHKGMAYESWYIAFSERHVIQRGGYRTFPYAIGRYRMAPREHYGRSPAAVAYPAIRTLNEQKKTALRAGQKAVDPPLLLSEEGALTNFNLRGGALNYGALSADGTPLVQPLNLGDAGRFQIGKELMELEANAINDAFLVSLFQILVQNPTMTATEAMIRAQEKGMLIAPAMGRQQSEFLGPQIVREIDILHHAGQLPPPPMQLLKKGLQIEYTSPLSKLMRAEEATTIMTSIQGLSQMASVQPKILDLVDWDETSREFLEAGGFPGKLILDPDKLAAVREAKQQQDQAQQIVQGAPAVSQSALNLAKAQQAMTQPQGGGNAATGQG